MPAAIVEDEQVVALHQGDTDTCRQQRVGEVIGQLADATVEEAHQVVAGVEAVETLVLLHQHAVAQAVLLAEDDRLRQPAENLIHLRVGDVALTQAGVGSMVTRWSRHRRGRA